MTRVQLAALTVVVLGLVSPAAGVEGGWDALSAQAFEHYAAGRHPEALRAAADALRLAEAAQPADPDQIATSASILASMHHAQGQYQEARRHYRQALAAYRRTLGEDHPHTRAIEEALDQLPGSGWARVPGRGPAGTPFGRGTTRRSMSELNRLGLESDALLTLGHRVDNLKWNIAGDLTGQNPNVLSELTWSDLQTIQIKGRYAATIRQHWYVRGAGDFGWIVNGASQDSDYLGDDRTLEFSRSENEGGGHVYDLSIGGGYRWRVLQDRLSVAPLLGYSYHRQELTMSKGFQTVSRFGFGVPIGAIENLRSEYDATWDGLWFGTDVEVGPYRRWKLFGSFEYHLADYFGRGNWNLRTDFRHPESFTHRADGGSGIVLSIGVAYVLSERWLVEAGFAYQDWSVGSGLDTTYFADGTTAQTRLNEVTWDSYAASLGMRYQY